LGESIINAHTQTPTPTHKIAKIDSKTWHSMDSEKLRSRTLETMNLYSRNQVLVLSKPGTLYPSSKLCTVYSQNFVLPPEI